ncbi:hypothetical protein BsWGS_22209 [Bradybaena similaris]
MAALTWRRAAGLIATGLLVSGLLPDICGQVTDPGLCRRQCEAEIKFFQQLFFKPEYVADKARQCLSLCPEPQTTPPGEYLHSSPTTSALVLVGGALVCFPRR